MPARSCRTRTSVFRINLDCRDQLPPVFLFPWHRIIFYYLNII